MRIAVWVLAGSWLLTSAADTTAPPLELSYPKIQNHGGIVSLPDAAQQPRAAAKVVFDITTDNAPGEVNRGLDRVARYVNLSAGAGVDSGRIQIAAVVHGPATQSILKDSAYARHRETRENPNLDLIRQLKAAGVELYVCGQALAHHRFDQADVAPEVTIAVAAMTVSVNKQLEGYAYLPMR
jgi:intracellular sulfur oxidation DsrE/DsrF family protein